jgi:hypothetical protein
VALASIVEASDANGVKAMVEGHSGFMPPGNTIEVHEIMPMM